VHHGIVAVQVFLAIKEDFEVKDRVRCDVAWTAHCFLHRQVDSDGRMRWQDGDTALFKAAVGGYPTRVAALAAKGADVNAVKQVMDCSVLA
jgi:hypothetical protein